MLTVDPRTPGFETIRALIRRMEADPKKDRKSLVSVDDRDVPAWQRQTVWNPEEMGLLAYSILRKYPIGMIILWKKPDGARVPIDGRQRLTAIRSFFQGDVALPDLPSIPDDLKNKKYKLLDGDAKKGYTELSIEEKEAFDEYALKAIEYEDIDENTAMEIFVMLQGGKSLTKTEVRSALGGKICDFVTDLTSGTSSSNEEIEEDDAEDPPPSRHAFFNELSSNLKNIRKAHRNVADVLLHEFLYSGLDKHWSSLEKMYREKAKSLTDAEKDEFRSTLGKFKNAISKKIGKKKVLLPQIRSTYFILSVFRCWQELRSNYDLPTNFNFAEEISVFETARANNGDDKPWVNFTAALSNAGYAQNKIQERHDILVSQILIRNPKIVLKKRDGKRTFSIEQKIAIWQRAEYRCEHVDGITQKRCSKVFENPRKADADHIVRWADNGPTTIENGRLLCRLHNRGAGKPTKSKS
ncbi:MAG: DUF262 domain-containing protein [Nibricoccus sp.]